MTGLIASQIRITGDLEKDQQLLIYGIGGLIGLIVIAMIVILVVVIVRRSKASRAAAVQQMAAVAAVSVPQDDAYKPTVSVTPVVEEPVKEETPPPAAEIIPDPKPEPQPEPQTLGLIQNTVKPSEAEAETELTTPDAEPAQVEEKKDSPKYDFGAYKEELAHQNPDDKMDEIRRRLEEIKRQRHTEPAPVLPKIEAKPAVHEVTPSTETGGDDPIVPEEEILAEEEIDETRLVNEEPEDPEIVPVTEVPQVERLEPAPEVEPQPEVATEEETPEEETPAPTEPPVNETPVAPVEEQQPTAEEPQPVEEEEPIEREEIRSEGHVYYTVPNEPVMELQRDPQPEPAQHTAEEKPAKTETAEIPFPNGKFLPMKKLTFAEWVELFK